MKITNLDPTETSIAGELISYGQVFTGHLTSIKPSIFLRVDNGFVDLVTSLTYLEALTVYNYVPMIAELTIKPERLKSEESDHELF